MRSRLSLRPLLIAFALFFLAIQAQAQTGCIDSPENPTALLALFGFAGAGTAAWRRRLRK